MNLKWAIIQNANVHPPQRASVAKPGTLLLIIILSLVCKHDIKEVHGKVSVDRNILAGRVNAETVPHLLIISYK